MHSWVFRNRSRLMALYGLQKLSDSTRPSSLDSWDGGSKGTRPILERRSSDQVILFPVARPRVWSQGA